MTDKKNSLEGKALESTPVATLDKPTSPAQVAYKDKIKKTFYASAVTAKTAKATLQVTNRAQAYGLLPLQTMELRSIYALFAWVANEQKAAPETVRGMTEARFNVADITRLRQRDYEDVIKFLVDLRLDELKH